MGWLLLVMAAVTPQPSAAVMALEARQGVSAESAALLTDHLVAQLKKEARFSRVVTRADVESTLNFEAQRQLLACDSASCIAEIAASLGVDFLVTGSLGRLESVLLVSLKLVDVRTGVAAAAISQPFENGSETAVLRAIPALVTQLLDEGKLPRTSVVTDEEKERESRLALPLRAAGGVVGAIAAASLPVVVGGVLVGLGSYAAYALLGRPDALRLPLNIASVGGAMVAAVAAAALILGAGVAVLLVGGSLVAP